MVSEAWKESKKATARLAAQAVDYDRYRPRYPQEVFDLLFHETGVARGDKVVEIGAGTGIATQALADLGLDVIAVDLLTSWPRSRPRSLGKRATS